MTDGDEHARARVRPGLPELQRVPSWLATTTAWTWRVLVLIIGAAAILVVLTRLYLVTLPVFIALLLATICVPPARWLEGRGFPRAAAAGTVVIGGVVVVGGFIAALTPAFIEEVQQLGPTLVEAFNEVLRWAEEGPLGWDQQQIRDFVSQMLQTIQGQTGQIVQQVGRGAQIIAEVVVALILALVLLFFFIKDGEQIVAWFIARSPQPHVDTIRAVARRAWVALSGFIRGTSIVALIDAIGIGIGLWIVGVPLVLPIALLVFIGGFIPVIGAFITGLLAVLVALAAVDVTAALIVLAIVVAVQQVESNVLQPMVMRRAVSLHPVVILGALTAGAALIGIIGAFLAVPLAAVASAVGNELRLRHEDNDGPAPVGPEYDPVPPDEL